MGDEGGAADQPEDYLLRDCDIKEGHLGQWVLALLLGHPHVMDVDFGA